MKKIFLFLFGALSILSCPLSAQDAGSTNPLPVIRTDSPRATLTTFLNAMNDYRAGVKTDDDIKKVRLQDAIYCLNLAAIPEGQRDFHGEYAALHLKEVIDRVALPEDLEFPADPGIKRWRLAGSLITIARVESGERVGEYLFTGETVKRARSLYTQVRALEYLPGSGQGALVNWKTEQKDEDGPFIKKDNPRYTMKTFITAMNDYRKGVMEGDDDLKARINTAISCLDLSGIPTVVRNEKGREAAILLKEVIDRIIVIDYEKIPIYEKNGDPVLRFRLKNSDERIIIRRLNEGDRAGTYLFTQDTVNGIKSFYNSIKNEPYKKGSGQGAAYKPDLLERTIPKWMKGTWVLFPNWQWCGLFLAILLGFVIKTLVQHVLMLIKGAAKRSKTDWDDKTIQAVEKPIGLIGAGVFWFFAIHALRFEGAPLAVLKITVQIILCIGFIWALYKLADVLTEYLETWAVKTDSTLDDQLVPLIKRSLRTFIVIFGVLITVQNLGFNVMSLLAGLGLGGLAFALAAQDTCSNFFGSVMILTDRPFQVGDFVVVGDVSGCIEQIGFRSTRIRSFYDSVITIPNSSLANANIDNRGQRRYRRQILTLGLTYDTAPEQMEAFVEGVKNIIKANHLTRKDYFHVVFKGYGDFSLNVYLYYFFETNDYSEELVERHNINLEILRFAAELGVEFAFPTQTMHMESFPEKEPTRLPSEFTVEEISQTAKSFGPNGDKARPSGSGIFTPPYRDPDLLASE